jgi:hypothetical protein
VPEIRGWGGFVGWSSEAGAAAWAAEIFALSASGNRYAL